MENFKGERFNKARSQTLNTINQASLTLTTAKAFWNNKRDYNHLLLLKEKADEIWSECLELSSRGYESLPNEISVALNYICERLEGKSDLNYDIKYYNGDDPYINELVKLIYDAEALLNENELQIDKKIIHHKPIYSKTIKENFSKDSLVLMQSMQYGIILFVSVIIAFGIGFERAYWIPVSCCSVLLGTSSLSTNKGHFKEHLAQL